MADGGFKLPGGGANTDHVLSFVVNYNDPAGFLAGTRPRGYIPMGAHVTDIVVMVHTAFNAASTNVVTVGGVSGTATNLVAAGDLDESTIATTIMTGFQAGAKLIYDSTVDYAVYSKYTQSGDAATAGKAIVTIKYSMPLATQGL